MKKSKEMKRYLRIVEESGCPECHSEDVYETHASVGRRDDVLVLICDECGHSETCPEQPKNMVRLIGGLGGSSIRDVDGSILPEFLKPSKKEK